MDGIIDTVSAVHPLLPLLDLLKVNGKLILLGVPEKPHELPAFPVVMGELAIILVYTKSRMVDWGARYKFEVN